jgi:hypothetical protein
LEEGNVVKRHPNMRKIYVKKRAQKKMNEDKKSTH